MKKNGRMMKEWWNDLRLKVFNIISLVGSRPGASFVGVYYIKLALMNSWMIKKRWKNDKIS